MKRIYLASPFFNEEELKVYRTAIAALRSNGYEVYVPQEHDIPNAWDLSNEEWAQQVFYADVAALEKSDTVMVLNHGMYSDTGTAWEAGYAAAKGKDVVQVIWGTNKTYSLMMMGNAKVVHLDNIGRWEQYTAGVNKSNIIQK